jgi:hypothetical protein
MFTNLTLRFILRFIALNLHQTLTTINSAGFACEELD